MKHRNFISSVAAILILMINIMSGPGCANIIPPQGGPRDSLPPLLIKASPGDSTRNFSGNKILFTFDEFVDVMNVQQSMVVSPLPKLNPQVDYRLNTVSVRWRDTLEPNTTYSINFGDAIKDYNEGNILKNFTYTFSTGRYIDSLELTGKVVLAETGKLDTTLIILLHTNPDDSAVIKEKPRYIAKMDSKGGFHFKNLPQKDFYLYALKDDGGTYRYFGDKQLFAFADKPITPSLTPDPVILYAYAANHDKAPSPAQSSSLNSMLGRTNRGKAGTAENRLKYQTNLSGNIQDLLTPFSITFEMPLRTFDTAKINVYTDSVYTPAPAYGFRKDSTGKTVTLVHQWKENTAYHIILDKDFAEDTAGKKLLKTDTIHFTTKKLTDYGFLQLKFRNLDMAKNPVLQILTGETIYKSFPLTGNTFTIERFLPGEYDLRILFDENKNGIWDPGQFFGKHKQPERVQLFERKISVKPAWQNEFELTL